MKKIFIILFIIILGMLTEIRAQTLNIAYPVDYSVLQRNSNNQAVVTIAGQVMSTGTLASHGFSYKITTLHSFIGGPSSAPVLFTYQPTGIFYNTLTLNAGWYKVEIGTLLGGVFTPIVTRKVGVGDVFIVAGQSNGQGVESTVWPLPSTSGYPEWIVGLNQNGNCTKRLPELEGSGYTYTSFYSMTDASNKYNRLAPTGNSVWCYAQLGKRISDQNGGMPVAFFNSASGGSTVTQWYQGAQGIFAPNGYVGGNQFCLGYNGGSTNPVDYYGQPYTPLKTSLNYYASRFGVRGILWHQGESDSDITRLSIPLRAANELDYQNKLIYVINKSRTDFGNSNLSWFISNATITTNSEPYGIIRTGQSGAIATSSNRLQGAESDYLTTIGGTNTINLRSSIPADKRTHFDNSQFIGPDYGLEFLAKKWFSAIGLNGNSIPATTVPTLTVTASGSNRILSVPSGYSEYRWGKTINDPIPGATSNTYTYTSSTSYNYIPLRCFVKNGSGNWQVTASFMPLCNTCRVGAPEDFALAGSEADEDYSEIQLKTYPAPFQKEFTAEFNVPSDNSVTTLEIIDVQGKVVKKVVDNPHAKGKWKYPINASDLLPNTIYLCRLRVGDTYSVKKIVKMD